MHGVLAAVFVAVFLVLGRPHFAAGDVDHDVRHCLALDDVDLRGQHALVPRTPPREEVRQPTLKARRESAATVWQRVTLSHRYGQGDKAVEITTGSAAWYSSGLPAVPLRWVLVSDPQGKLRPQVCLCTDEAAELEKNSGVVHLPLADRSHARRGTRPSGYGNATAMVRARHRAPRRRSWHSTRS